MTTLRGPLSQLEKAVLHKVAANSGTSAWVNVAMDLNDGLIAALARAEKAERDLHYALNRIDERKKEILSAEAQVAAMRGALGAIPARLEELAKTLRNGNGPEQTRIAEHDAILIAIGWLKSTTDRANIPASELGEAVRGVIDAARNIGFEGIGIQGLKLKDELDRLDAAMGKKS